MKSLVTRIIQTAVDSRGGDGCPCGNLDANDLIARVGRIIDAAPIEMTVLSMNDYPIGVYTSAQEASQAAEGFLKAICEGRTPYSNQVPHYVNNEEEKRQWIKARFHLHCRSFQVNETPAATR